MNNSEERKGGYTNPGFSNKTCAKIIDDDVYPSSVSVDKDQSALHLPNQNLILVKKSIQSAHINERACEKGGFKSGLRSYS